MSDYKKEVQHTLIDRGMTQMDLVRAVRDKTGLFCDSAYLSRILSGERKAPKIRAAIAEILQLPEEVHDAQN